MYRVKSSKFPPGRCLHWNRIRWSNSFGGSQATKQSFSGSLGKSNVGWVVGQKSNGVEHSEKTSFICTLASSHPQVMSGWVVILCTDTFLDCFLFFHVFLKMFLVSPIFMKRHKWTMHAFNSQLSCASQSSQVVLTRAAVASSTCVLAAEGSLDLSIETLAVWVWMSYSMSYENLMLHFLLLVLRFGKHRSLRQAASLGKALLTPQPGTRRSLGEIDIQ